MTYPLAEVISINPSFILWRKILIQIEGQIRFYIQASPACFSLFNGVLKILLIWQTTYWVECSKRWNIKLMLLDPRIYFSVLVGNVLEAVITRHESKKYVSPKNTSAVTSNEVQVKARPKLKPGRRHTHTCLHTCSYFTIAWEEV